RDDFCWVVSGNSRTCWPSGFPVIQTRPDLFSGRLPNRQQLPVHLTWVNGNAPQSLNVVERLLTDVGRETPWNKEDIGWRCSPGVVRVPESSASSRASLGSRLLDPNTSRASPGIRAGW